MYIGLMSLCKQSKSRLTSIKYPKRTKIFLLSQQLCFNRIMSLYYLQYQFLNSKKKMAKFFPKSSIKTKIIDFQLSQANFSSKLQALHDYLKHYPIEAIKESIAKASTLLAKVKWLILLHHVIMNQSSSDFTIVSDLVQSIDVTSEASLSSFDRLTFQKLINPYKLYLLKRHFYNTASSSIQNEIYFIMNLIRNALSFTDVVFTIGRYLYKNNKFLVEFNMAIGRDLARLYRKMRVKISEEQMLENAEVIEKMNEGLYNVYYNCYFSNFTSQLAPIWINTENLFQKLAERKKGEKVPNTPKKKIVEETIILENRVETDHTIYELEELEDCAEEFKSASTIESNEKETEYEKGSRKEFINFAESLLLEIEKMESGKDLIY